MAERVTSTTNMRLMELVHEGMKVVDSQGEEVGKVEELMMGDPGAATEQGNEFRDTGFIGDLAEVFVGDEREPDVPDAVRAKLLRTGYIKVDGGGFIFETDRYVQPDRIVSVRDETVYLNVPKSALIKEQ